MIIAADIERYEKKYFYTESKLVGNISVKIKLIR